jgi:hypothetical protein
MNKMYAGRGLVYMLATLSGRADEALFDLLFRYAEFVHSLGKESLFFWGYGKSDHAASFIGVCIDFDSS